MSHSEDLCRVGLSDFSKPQAVTGGHLAIHQKSISVCWYRGRQSNDRSTLDSLLAEYAYNTIGQRVKKERHFSDGNETCYFYAPDGTKLGNYKLKPSDAWDYVDYIWLDGAPVAQLTEGDWASGYAKPEDAIWLHFNHLNTPRVGTNDSQTEA